MAVAIFVGPAKYTRTRARNFDTQLLRQFRCDHNLLTLQFAIFRLPSHAFRNSFLIIPLCEHQAQVIHRSCRVLSDFRICCVCSKFLQHGLMLNVYIRKIAWTIRRTTFFITVYFNFPKSFFQTFS